MSVISDYEGEKAIHRIAMARIAVLDVEITKQKAILEKKKADYKLTMNLICAHEQGLASKLNRFKNIVNGSRFILNEEAKLDYASSQDIHDLIELVGVMI